LSGLAALVVVGTVVAALGAAFLQWQAAARAKSGELANKALLELDEDPARSAHLALAAVKLNPDNRQAEYALRQSMATLETAHTERIISLHEPIVDARFSDDKKALVVASIHDVMVYDSGSYEMLYGPLRREWPLRKAWLIAGNTLLVTLTDDGQAQLQTVDGGPIRALSCAGDGNSIYRLEVSSDGKHIPAGCFNGEIRVWDASGADAQQWPPLTDGATITALTFSADNQYLASGDNVGNATIWKLGQPEPWIGMGNNLKKSPIRHFAAIRDVDFHPSDSELLATASDDGTAIVWRLDLEHRQVPAEKTGERTKWTMKHDRSVTSAKVRPRTNDNPLMTVLDKYVYFWTNEQDRDVRSHDDQVNDANVSKDGELVVSASSDGTARVWSARSGAPIAVLRGHRHQVTRAFFGP